MAAMSRSAASLTNIEECTTSNVLGTQNILGAARDAGVRKVIYSGSSTYYGNQPAPHHEGWPATSSIFTASPSTSAKNIA